MMYPTKDPKQQKVRLLPPGAPVHTAPSYGHACDGFPQIHRGAQLPVPVTCSSSPLWLRIPQRSALLEGKGLVGEDPSFFLDVDLGFYQEGSGPTWASTEAPWTLEFLPSTAQLEADCEVSFRSGPWPAITSHSAVVTLVVIFKNGDFASTHPTALKWFA